MMARELGLSSRSGAVLNEAGDVISDVALYAPFAIVGPFSPAAVFVAVMLSVLTEIVGMAPLLAGGARRYDGPMGKSDRAVAFGVMAIALVASRRSFVWAPAMLAGVIVLLAVTVVKRASHAFSEVRS
jgi:CDP-diacylglycerol--glycerol-3-phosphate 3-phosphatidyltransferase